MARQVVWNKSAVRKFDEIIDFLGCCCMNQFYSE